MSFKKPKEKRYLKNVLKDRDVLNPIRKTKTESYPDLQAEYAQKIKDLKREEQLIRTKEKIEEKKQEDEAKKVNKEIKIAKKKKENEYKEFFEDRHEEEKKANEDNEDMIDDFW